jgi:hypothetical protein
MARQSGRHMRGPAPAARKVPPCMWRGPGMELSDELYAQQPLHGWRGRLENSMSCSNVLHLNVETTRGRITRTLNTSSDAEAIERAKPIVAKAVNDGRIRPSSLAALTYAAPRSTKPVCCKVQLSGNYSTKIALLDGSVGFMSLDTRNDELARDRMRVVVADWLARGLIPPTGKAARVYGRGGLDAGFRSESSRLEAERWLAGKRRPLRFMQWARGPGGKRVLQCAVYLDGSTARHKGSRNYRRLSPSLNTSDPDVAAQRMRLILWHAIAEGRLPSGVKHPAWGLYGGPISQSTKRLLKRLAALPWAEYELQRKTAAAVLGLHERTVDWLTNQDKARQHDPVRRARARTIARSRTRKEKRTPISRSWHFSAVGGMLAVHPDGNHIYAQLTIAGFTLRWRLAVQNRAEGEALVKPAVDARARVREAARDWRECLVGSREAATALEACSDAQRLYLQALRGAGAERADGWAEFARLVLEPPWDAGTGSKPPRAASVRAKKKCLVLMKADARRNPDRPPYPHREYANSMRRRIPGLKHREFEECWRGVLALPEVKWGGTNGKGGRRKSDP